MQYTENLTSFMYRWPRSYQVNTRLSPPARTVPCPSVT